MRVLLTNNTLDFRAGSELYVRDVAVELLRRGHHPVAYSTTLGEVARELRSATVPVISKLECLGEPPDIIHGHHHYETLSAMLHFPETPAISYCHGWFPWQEAPLRFPRILRYVAVDEVCRERLIAEGGIEPSKIEVLLNFFDATLFPSRMPLPPKPLTAIAFSNQFSEASYLPVLREACLRYGIRLDAAGLAVGKIETDVGALLARYDLVFAKGRAAIEAMAVGAAVVLCDPGRLGSLITTRNFAALRRLNFGARTMNRPLGVDALASELQGYNAGDAMALSHMVRENCELRPAVDRIIALYEQVIAQARQIPLKASIEGDRAATRYLEESAPRYKQSGMELDRDRWAMRCLAAEAALEAATQETEPPPLAHLSGLHVIQDAHPGYIESVVETGGSVLIEGWAIQPVTGQSATHVLFADGDGRIVTSARVGTARSDVAGVHGAATLKSGFRARVPKGPQITCLSFTLGAAEAFAFPNSIRA